jgi:hypothetical protein
VTGSKRQPLESAPHFQTKIFATPMRKCVGAMTLKVLAASSLFAGIEVPRDTIQLTLWNVDVFVARKTRVAEREKSGRRWHTSGVLVAVSSHDETRHRGTVTRSEIHSFG